MVKFIRRAQAIRSFSVAVSVDGILAALGDDQLVNKYPNAQIIDLGGRAVYPGFFDSHMHILHYGIVLDACNLKGCVDSNDLVDRLKEHISSRKIPAGRVIWARGFNEENFLDKRMPDRYMLDNVSTTNPILIVRVCGHLAVANSAMLAKAGMTSGFAVDGGHIDCDASGTPTGIVRENALRIVYEQLDELSVTEIKSALLNAQKELFKRGITTIGSDDISSLRNERNYDRVWQAYRELYEEGNLKIRVFEQALLPDMETFTKFTNEGKHFGERFGRFTLSSLKILADGSLGARTARLRDPYADKPDTKGISVYTREALAEMVLAAQKAGMPVAIHAIGDATLDDALDAIEAAQKACLGKLRHAIVHCQITDEKQIQRFSELGVSALVQPIFVATDMAIAESRLGKKRASTSYNWKRFIQCGTHISFGSDCPVEDPAALPNLYCAITRMNLKGQPEGGWLPDQKLTLSEGLTCLTREAAYTLSAEDSLGTLAIGKAADMTILDEDLSEAEPCHIKDIPVYMTVVAGEPVYIKKNVK